MKKDILNFYRGKRVFVTGHTGFKGSWMCRVLLNAGAKVAGYSLEPPTSPNLFHLSELGERMVSVIGDIRDYSSLKSTLEEFQPEIIFHLAAQPIVRDSYKDPVGTYETNVLGTIYLLECIRRLDCVRSVINITTDKVYHNNEWDWGYRENESLDGFDPYSNSKSCSELVTSSYKRSFFQEKEVAISTARAGNVLGGGDFAPDRIIPDCIRAQIEKSKIAVRNPMSTRPYQHVLEPIAAYLMIAQRQWTDRSLAGCYNVGPDDCDCVTTGELVELFCKTWGDGAEWVSVAEENSPHEANFLKLDCTKLKTVFDWSPRWNIVTVIEKTCEWSKAWIMESSLSEVMDKQISEYFCDNSG